MKKWWFLFVCIFGLGLGYIFSPKFKEIKPPKKSEHLKNSYGPYFFIVPISKFSSSNIPCIMIKIEEQYIITELDLGYRGDIAFNTEILNTIDKKAVKGEKSIYGIRGKCYKEKKYTAPKMEIGKLTFSNFLMNEESNEFVVDACILKEHENNDSNALGRVGWKLFRNSNIFLDLENLQIAFCDSIQTLSKQGYPVEEFIKTPMYTERGLVELVVENPNSYGSQRWALDTGATWNMIVINNDNKTIEEIASDPNYQFEASIKIGNQSFGPMPFHKLPLRLPFHIDGMLGMEFFKNHQVFVDFAENQIYIRKGGKIQDMVY